MFQRSEKGCAMENVLMPETLLARKDEAGNPQTLYDHLHNTAELAAAFERLSFVTAYTAGVLHDSGKATDDFKQYLLTGNRKRGEVIHAKQGAFIIDDCAANYPSSLASMLTAEVLELAIANHHGHLPDCLDAYGKATYFGTLTGENKNAGQYHYQEVLSHIASLDLDIDANFANSLAETNSLLIAIDSCGLSPRNVRNSRDFFLGLYAKYIYSRLVDADRVDAAHFMAHQPYASQTPNWDDLTHRLENAINVFDASSEIGKIRMRISEDCLAASTRDTGIYRLNVPTGGGKTVASLRFALHHAKKTGKHRIIYIAPYLSITEQTVQVFRNVLDLGKDNNEVLLEHFSSVVPDKDDEKEQQRRLAAERWDKPIIVTTMVQFLETVMSAKATKLRKFHNMADSVIVFDEIQALPTNTINVFNEVVSFLSKILGSTILLCSATQPLLEQTDRKNLLLSDKPDLIDSNNDYAERLRRTNIVSSLRELTLDDFATEIYDKALENGNCLAVVNLKSEAKRLYQLVKELDVDHRFTLVHLSTAMCGAHRKDQLAVLKECLPKKFGDPGRPVICISTQLIEAGVDISFSCVIRAMAGLDSILQAAGRCNRNGESQTPKNVYVYPIKDEAGLKYLPEIQLGKDITDQLIHDYPEQDLLSECMIEEYYRAYLIRYPKLKDSKTRNIGTMDYLISGNEETAYDLLSFNRHRRGQYLNRTGEQYPYELAQAFQTVGDNFRVVPGGTTDVVVHYGQAMELINQLDDEGDFASKIKTLRSLQEYTVSLFDYEFKALDKSKSISEENGDFDILVLNEENYSQEFGFLLEAEMPLLMK